MDVAEFGAAETLNMLTFEMVKALVDEPEDVTVATRDEEGAVVLLVNVAPGDIGKVIGRQGRTARSLRTILGAAAMKLGTRCELNIHEPAL